MALIPPPRPRYQLADLAEARYALIGIIEGNLIPAAVDVIDASIDRDPDAFPELMFLLTPRKGGGTAYTDREEPEHSRDVRLRRALAEQLVDRLLSDEELVIYPVPPAPEPLGPESLIQTPRDAMELLGDAAGWAGSSIAVRTQAGELLLVFPSPDGTPQLVFQGVPGLVDRPEGAPASAGPTVIRRSGSLSELASGDWPLIVLGADPALVDGPR